MYRADLEHRLARLREPLVISAVPPVPAQPGKGALHHVALRLFHEPDTSQRTTHDLDLLPHLGLDQPIVPMMIMILAVRPDALQASLVLGRQSGQDVGSERP